MECTEEGAEKAYSVNPVLIKMMMVMGQELTEQFQDIRANS